MKSNSENYRLTMALGAEADQRLDQLTGTKNSRQSVFIPALNAARNGFGVPGRLAPPSARGLRAWIDGTEELRLRLEPHGWKVPQISLLDSAGLVLSPSSTVAISLVAGDNATGRASYLPQVRYPRGPASAEFIQGSMFPDHVPEQAPNVDIWYLLHEISATGWQAELSKPAGIGKGGWVTEWQARIQIVLDDPTTGGDGAKRDSSPQLPQPSVRWRQSA